MSSLPGAFPGQSQAIADYVFPICNVEQTTDGLNITAFLGTGFFIGSNGYALTAKHVMKPAATPAIVMRGSDLSWRAFAIKEEDAHPVEDVSLIRIEPPSDKRWRSIFTLPGGWAGSSTPYFLFGYPESVLLELVENGKAKMRPDLVYSEDHIRRRMTDIPVEAITGTRFFELSNVAGPGCSGSPVVNRTPTSNPAWQLIGIYLGERLDAYSTSVGYSVRLDELADWHPAMLHRSLAAEANDPG